MADASARRIRSQPTDPVFSRRAALGLGGAAIVATAVGSAMPASADGPVRPAARRATVGAPRPEIRPRADWGDDLPVTGEIVPEDDVRFLLVHHTASTNDYGPDDVIRQIRGFHEFHTGPEKGWPDVAYNFFVDRFGTIWEARAGSIDGPVRGDATGGSQGHALLCSLIGDHSQVPVSDEALDSLTRLLAWLADRHGVDTSPGATIDFVSRGSNKWPEGAAVTARTISGHREMSSTSCPGEFAFSLLDATIPGRVTELRTAAAAATTSSTAPPPTTATTVPAPTGPASTAPASTADLGEQAVADTSSSELEAPALIGGVGAALAAVLAGLTLRSRRRASPR